MYHTFIHTRPTKPLTLARLKSIEPIPIETHIPDIRESEEWGFVASWSDSEVDDTNETLFKRRKTSYHGVLKKAAYTLRSAQNDSKIGDGIERQMEIYLAARAMEAYARKLESQAKLVEAETRLAEARMALAKLCPLQNEE